jgi:hypothetical protein
MESRPVDRNMYNPEYSRWCERKLESTLLPLTNTQRQESKTTAGPPLMAL